MSYVPTALEIDVETLAKTVLSYRRSYTARKRCTNAALGSSCASREESKRVLGWLTRQCVELEKENQTVEIADVLRSSIFPHSGTSPCRTPTPAIGSSTTGRSTTSANFGKNSSKSAHASSVTPTPRYCSRHMPVGVKHASLDLRRESPPVAPGARSDGHQAAVLHTGGFVFSLRVRGAQLAWDRTPATPDRCSRPHELPQLRFVLRSPDADRGRQEFARGTLSCLEGWSLHLSQYWDLVDGAGEQRPQQPTFARDEKHAASELQPMLEYSVRMQLVSDVPVGVFLSGGIDSSAL